jgi:hypothetical protein
MAQISDYQKFSQRTQGWPRAGFRERTVNISVRRVEVSDRSEAQIEIHLVEMKDSGRMMSKVFGITLSPEDAERFALALTSTDSPRTRKEKV